MSRRETPQNAPVPTFGVVLLCHAPLARATEVARHWAGHGVPVAVHIDAATPAPEAKAMHRALKGAGSVIFVARQRSEWGRWGLVAASLDAARALLDRHPDLGHVMLTSGACLPIRPVAELGAHLAAHPDTDFIEAAPLGGPRWSKGGLEAERFTLFFPVSWRRHRRLFDLLVRLQRWLGVRRRLPPGLVPHQGLQWWCLSAATLRAILTDPDLPRLRRYFQGVWIPDESFFQSLAARHGRTLAPPLTFQRFDTRGNPHVLYDDHLPLLAACPAFVARKVWPGADGLYRAFLDTPEASRAAAVAAPDALEREIAKAHRLRREGRMGLRSMGRLPDPALGLPPTAAPYGVFWGLDAAMPGFAEWLAQVAAAAGADAHGRLFAPDRVWFANIGPEAVTGPGALSTSAALRDYAPVDFLSNLIWATRGRTQMFLADAGDGARVAAALAADPHARGLVLTRTADAVHPAEAQAEAAGLAMLRAPNARHGLRILSAEAFRADPAAHLAQVFDALGLPPSATRPFLQPAALPSAQTVPRLP